MTGPTGGTPGLRKEFVLLAAAFLVLGVLRLNDLFLYTPDGARYLVWGNSIAHGHGWLDDTQPEPLRFVIHAPLYPVLLAPAEFVFPLRAVPAKAWTLLWGLSAVALLYIWLYRHSGRWPAFAGALMFALNPGFLVWSTEVLSEAPFMAFMLAAVLLATKAADGARLSRAEWLALLAVSSTIGLLREVGVVVTICVALALWKTGWRRALTVLACAAACLGAWYLRNSVLVGAPAGSPGSNLALAFTQAAGGGDAPALTGFAARTMSNIASYVTHAAGMAFYPLYGPQHTLLLGAPVAVPDPVRWCAAVLFGGLAVAGIVRSARRGPAGLMPVAAAAALLLAAAVYPVRDTRFVAPLLPLTIAWIVAAFIPSRNEAASPGRRIALFATAALAVVPNVPAIAEIVSLNLRYLRAPVELHASLSAVGDAPNYYGRPWSIAGNWIGDNLPADAVLATPAKELAVVSGGRKVLELDPGVPQALFERLLRTNGVTHILAPSRWADVRVYEPLMERSRRAAFTAVYDAGSLRLYRIDWRPFIDGRAGTPVPPSSGGAAGLLRTARAAIGSGRFADASRLLDSASALAPGRAEILYEAVVAAAMAGDSGRAGAAFSALAQLPQAGSFLAPGRNHLRLATEISAIETLAAGGERSMRALDASRAYWDMGYYEIARRLLGPVAGADTSFFVGLLWNFHFNFQLGDTTAARRSLDLLDRIDSANSLVKNFHSLMALRRQVRATAPSPARAALRLRMAEIYRDIELFDEAYEEGEGALREDRTSAEPARFLADLYAKQGYHRRALAYYRDVLAADPGDDVVRAVADSLALIAGP